MTTTWPEARTATTEFESGAWLIDVRFDAELVVIEYAPPKGFGVTLITDDTPSFDSGHDAVCDTAEEIIEALRKIVSELRTAR